MLKNQIITNNQTTVDIFEDLRACVGCLTISDLCFKPHTRKAKKVLKQFDLELYPLRQLNDLAQYLYAEVKDFAHHQQARQFFCNSTEPKVKIFGKLLKG